MSRPLGSWMTCEWCDGLGYFDHGNAWDGGRREDCDFCDASGRVQLPMTGAQARECEPEGFMTDAYLCVSDLTEGRCGHCSDLAAAEFSWMARAVVAHRAAGHHCNPYSAEGCHCGVAA